MHDRTLALLQHTAITAALVSAALTACADTTPPQSADQGSAGVPFVPRLPDERRADMASNNAPSNNAPGNNAGNNDAGNNDAGNNDTPVDAGDDPFDVQQDDAFVRPTPDADTEDAEADAPPPDDDLTVTGQRDCLQYELIAASDVFTLKEDVIGVRYQINNICDTPIRLRARSESDFFPVGIHKNGEPWIFMPDCPGQGPITEYTFNPGDGFVRGWLWSPDDHEARQTRCGVTYEADATYELIGYGLNPVPMGTNDFSDTFPLTDTISIVLVPE